jgi:hypothetical protein
MTDFMEWCLDWMRHQEPDGVVVLSLVLIFAIGFAVFSFAAFIVTKGAALLLLPVALCILYRNDTRSKLND